MRAITRFMDRADTVGEVYNIGSDEEVSMNQMAERVRELAGSSSEIEHVPYEEVYGPGFEDMRRRTPDIGKIERAIGYAPTHTLDDILRAVSRTSKRKRWLWAPTSAFPRSRCRLPEGI